MSSAGAARRAVDRAAGYMLRATVVERLGIAVAATAAALLVGLIVVAVAGYDPIRFASQLVGGAFGGGNAISRTLRYTTLFVLAGVAVAVAFRAGVFNIGVQGQLIVGGAACVWSILAVTPYVPGGGVGGVALILVGLLAALVGGGLYGAFPGVLRAYAGANEIITTIMLNFIAIGAIGWAVDNGPLRDPESGTPRTAFLPENVSPLPSPVFGDSSFSVLALAGTVVVVAVVMARTRFGYDMITSGTQATAATYSGISAERTIVATMTLSGMIAGLTGAVWAIMIQGYFSDPAGIGSYGFDAIAVSLLAANNPLGVIPAGLLFGALDSGGAHIRINSDVPIQLTDGIVGLVVLFVAAPELFRMLARRTGLGGERR